MKVSQDQLTAPEPDEATSGSRSVRIGRGTHAAIELDSDSGVVCKHFRASQRSELADFVEREFTYLKALSPVLIREPFLTCPQPVTADPEQGKVWMTHCPGDDLNRMLGDRNCSIEPELDHIAAQIANAVELYIDTFHEPYFDLATKNMLYDSTSRTLAVVDFSSRRRFRHPSSKETAPEVSLGVFVGLSLWESTRPKALSNPIFWRRIRRLSTSLLDQLTERHVVDLDLVRQVSSEVYRHSARWGWPWPRPWSLRGLWYGTVGQFAFGFRRDMILRECRKSLQVDT